MFKFFIKFTHQISAVINCFSSIIVHIFMIEKNLNCLLSFSTLQYFSQCRKDHTHLRFHKLIICSVTKTEFFMPLLIIIMITSFSKVSFMISSTSCITSTALTSILDPITERRNLKASLISTQVKREASKGGRSRDKSSSLIRHC